MAYKQKGFSAHDNMKTRPKDLSGRTSINQRTPQVKPGDSPSKAALRRRKSPAQLRYAPGSDAHLNQAWNTGSNVSGAMGNQAGAAASNIHQMQQTSGFVNNPGLADFNKNQPSKPQRVFGAMETGMGPRTAVAGGLTKDASEVAAKSRGSIQDMINQTISKVQTTQNAKRATALNKYKSDLAKKRAATKSAHDASIASWKSKLGASQSKNKSMAAAHAKMLAAQKAAAAKANIRRRRRGGAAGAVGSVLGGVTKGVGGVVKGVSKAAGGIVKGIGRALGGIFGRRRRRRRRRSTPKKTIKKATGTVKKATKGVGKVIGSIFGRRRRRKSSGKPPKKKSGRRRGGIFGGIFGRRRRRKAVVKKKTTVKKTTVKKATVKKKVAPKRRRRRRRRRRWFSDVRLKQNIMLIGSSKSGIPIYNFNYIGDNNIYQGTMAQDLISMGYNSAVTTDNKSGYYMVDYDQIDVDMIKI